MSTITRQINTLSIPLQAVPSLPTPNSPAPDSHLTPPVPSRRRAELGVVCATPAPPPSVRRSTAPAEAHTRCTGRPRGLICGSGHAGVYRMTYRAGHRARRGGERRRRDSPRAGVVRMSVLGSSRLCWTRHSGASPSLPFSLWKGSGKGLMDAGLAGHCRMRCGTSRVHLDKTCLARSGQGTRRASSMYVSVERRLPRPVSHSLWVCADGGP